VPAHVALFTTYEFAKGQLLVDGSDPVRAALCGAAATLSHDVILTPMDVVKQRMQLGVHASITDCLRSIRQREGLIALFRSMPTTLLMNLPFGGAFAASNETIKSVLGVQDSKGQKSLSRYFLSAGVSGAVAAAVTHPLDVVKTRLQTQDCYTASVASNEGQVRAPVYRGFVGTFSSIARTEGLAGLYRGVVPRMLYNAPAAAICWGTYESIKSWFQS